MLDNKRILITGGAGTFGVAFCKYLQKIKAKPEKVIILSRDPLKHQNMKAELGKTDYIINYLVRDIRDKSGLERAFNKVDIVIHAAAIKHIVECEYNPKEALLTNVIGTQNVVDEAIDNGVKRILFISTDKACNPINTYGTSKAMAERLVIQGNSYVGGKDIRLSVCRYGNVIGSNGSVLQLYKRLVDQGAERLPLTDERMTRFWYAIESAVKFIVDSLTIMQGGETFIPKIPTIRIIDLIKAFGKEPEIIGIRPGEKLHEIMIPQGVEAYEFDGYYVIAPTMVFGDNSDYSQKVLMAGIMTEPDEGYFKMTNPGTRVPEGFQYDSLTNPHYLTIEEIGAIL